MRVVTKLGNVWPFIFPHWCTKLWYGHRTLHSFRQITGAGLKVWRQICGDHFKFSHLKLNNHIKWNFCFFKRWCHFDDNIYELKLLIPPCIFTSAFPQNYITYRGPGSSVGIVNDYGLDGSGIESRNHIKWNFVSSKDDVTLMIIAMNLSYL
jgi:hypothetical protein